MPILQSAIAEIGMQIRLVIAPSLGFGSTVNDRTGGPKSSPTLSPACAVCSPASLDHVLPETARRGQASPRARIYRISAAIFRRREPKSRGVALKLLLQMRRHVGDNQRIVAFVAQLEDVADSMNLGN